MRSTHTHPGVCGQDRTTGPPYKDPEGTYEETWQPEVYTCCWNQQMEFRNKYHTHFPKLNVASSGNGGLAGGLGGTLQNRLILRPGTQHME